MTKFEFLDSVRGFLAVTVALGHYYFQNRNTCWDIFDWFHTLIGVFGFFILSSFLLTYRLLSEFINIFSKTDKTICDKIKLTISSIVKFVIRRIFRIFPLYITVVLADKYCSVFTLSEITGLPTKFWDIIFINNSEINIVWTVRVEFIYYLFIPFICLFTSLCSKKFRVLPVVMLIAVCIYCDIHWTVKKCGGNSYCIHIYFKAWFSAFLAGSLLAIIYYWVEDYALSISNTDIQCHNIFDSILSSRILKLLNIFCYFLSVIFILLLDRRLDLLSLVNIKYHSILLFNYPAYHWCLVLFLALLSRGSFTNLFNNRFWNHAGKISFSIYLMHMVPLVYLKKIMNPLLYRGFEGFTIYVFLFMITSTLTYYLIEYPGMKIGTKLCRLVDTVFV